MTRMPEKTIRTSICGDAAATRGPSGGMHRGAAIAVGKDEQLGPGGRHLGDRVELTLGIDQDRDGDRLADVVPGSSSIALVEGGAARWRVQNPGRGMPRGAGRTRSDQPDHHADRGGHDQPQPAGRAEVGQSPGTVAPRPANQTTTRADVTKTALRQTVCARTRWSPMLPKQPHEGRGSKVMARAMMSRRREEREGGPAGEPCEGHPRRQHRERQDDLADRQGTGDGQVLQEARQAQQRDGADRGGGAVGPWRRRSSRARRPGSGSHDSGRDRHGAQSGSVLSPGCRHGHALGGRLHAREGRTDRLKAIARQQPSAVLLLVQILVILLLPWLQAVSYGRSSSACSASSR